MKYKKLLSILILLTLILLAILYLKNNINEFKSLTLNNPLLIIPIIIFFIINYFSLALGNIVLFKSLNLNIKFLESFQLSIVTGFYNLITPFRGGMAVRALYLKKRHNFSYTNFLAALAASYVLIFLIAGIVGIITTYLIFKSTQVFSLLIFIIFLFTIILMLGIIIISPTISPTKYKFINLFIKVINGWNLIRNNKKVILSTLILSLFQLLISAVSLYLQFNVFGINISYTSALFISALNSIAILLAITPAGLGISEAITVFSALTIGISPVESLSAALLGRAVSLAVLFILGPIFSYILLKNK